MECYQILLTFSDPKIKQRMQTPKLHPNRMLPAWVGGGMPNGRYAEQK